VHRIKLGPIQEEKGLKEGPQKKKGVHRWRNQESRECVVKVREENRKES